MAAHLTDLDTLCRSPWADVPQSRIPANWREVTPPISVVRENRTADKLLTTLAPRSQNRPVRKVGWKRYRSRTLRKVPKRKISNAALEKRISEAAGDVERLRVEQAIREGGEWA